MLATVFGHKAIELILSDKIGELVVKQHAQITSVPLAWVADRQRLVPLDDPAIEAARGVGTSSGKRKLLRPSNLRRVGATSSDRAITPILLRGHITA